MSLDAWRWAWGISAPITSTQQLILLAMADRADEIDQAWPSHRRLADDCRLDIKTVGPNLDKLEQMGLIFDTQKRVGPRKKTKVYKLVGIVHREDTRKRGDSKIDPPQARRDAACGPAENEDTRNRGDSICNDPESGGYTFESTQNRGRTDTQNRGLTDTRKRGQNLLRNHPRNQDRRAPPASNEAAPSRDGFQDPDRIQVTEHDRESGRRKTDALLAAWDQPEPEANHG